METGLFADVEARTVRGVLMPWGELSRPSVSKTEPVMFERGSIKLPRDVSIVTANIEHNRFYPVARATAIEDTDAGLVATFSVADTEDGDDLLAQVTAGKIARLSAEVRDLIRDGAKAVSAFLTGASFVKQGAFEGAALFSIAEDEELSVEERIAQLEEQLASLKAEQEKTPEEEETSEETTEETETDTEKEDTVSTVSNTATEVAPEEKDTDLTGLFSLINTAKSGFGREAKEAEQALFALSDIHYDSGANQLGAPIRQPAFVGELWQGRSFERKIIPLVSQAPLRALQNKGFRWVTKPTVSEWTGNKSEISSSTGSVETYTYSAVRFAGGWDIAREYFDFNETAIIESFLQHAVNDYARKSDAKTLTDVLGAATAVEAETYPTGVGAAMGKIVQGALAVIDAGGTPTSAVVAPDVYKSLVYTREQDRLAFLNAAVGLEEGSVTSFRVVPHVDLDAGDALVFDRQAITSEELPGSPIRVNAIDLARGGYDEALFAYIATRIDYPDAIVLVSNAA